jgi:hypothetical protein
VTLGKDDNGECQYCNLFASVILSRPPRVINEQANWELRACATRDRMESGNNIEYEKLLWRLEGEENVYQLTSNGEKVEPRESNSSLPQRANSNSTKPLKPDLKFDGESFDREWESVSIKYDEGADKVPSTMEDRIKEHAAQNNNDIEKHCSLDRRLASRLYLLTKKDDGHWCFPGQLSSCVVQENLRYAALENAVREFGREIAEQVKPIGRAPCGHYVREFDADERNGNRFSSVFFFMYEINSSKYTLNTSSSAFETAWVASDELYQYFNDGMYVKYLRKMLP